MQFCAAAGADLRVPRKAIGADCGFAAGPGWAGIKAIDVKTWETR